MCKFSLKLILTNFVIAEQNTRTRITSQQYFANGFPESEQAQSSNGQAQSNEDGGSIVHVGFTPIYAPTQTDITNDTDNDTGAAQQQQDPTFVINEEIKQDEIND